jgi:hypothetical protein
MTYFMTTLTRCAQTDTQTDRQTNRPSCRVDLALWAGSTKNDVLLHALIVFCTNVNFCLRKIQIWWLDLPVLLGRESQISLAVLKQATFQQSTEIPDRDFLEPQEDSTSTARDRDWKVVLKQWLFAERNCFEIDINSIFLCSRLL